jgi:hypothetical protein
VARIEALLFSQHEQGLCAARPLVQFSYPGLWEGLILQLDVVQKFLFKSTNGSWRSPGLGRNVVLVEQSEHGTPINCGHQHHLGNGKNLAP